MDEKNDKLPFPGEIIKTRRNEYEVFRLLGKGGFGAVYEVKRLHDGEFFAVKCETYDVKKRVLSMDSRVLRGAFSIKSPHFCSIVDRGKIVDRFRYVVMKLVGRNLWDLRIERERQRFSTNTALKAAEQCLISIEDLHRVGYLHRDIKPGNFAIGRPETNEVQIVFMLDFGLCRKFMGEEEKKDLRLPRSTAPFRGTTRYAPIAALKQLEQSRKDDVEAWLYMVVEWTAGSLPWRKLKGSDKNEVLKWKEEVRSGEALDDFFQDCPKRQFTAIMNYLDSLVYYSLPDYGHILYCLSHAAKIHNISPTEPLDWDPEHKYTGEDKAGRDKRLELVAKVEDEDTDQKKTITKKKSKSTL